MNNSKTTDVSTGWKFDPVEHYRHSSRKPRPDICDTILDCIGNSPIVRLNRIPKSEGLECDILVKCEFFNAGGSVKDRIAKRMIEEAEQNGLINKDTTIIEPTSGNTGIGLALVSALKGYKTIITIPEKMSLEKINLLKALGSKIIQTPTEAASDAPESHISVARQIHSSTPNSIILDQYSNAYNVMAHYDETAEEILAATNQGKDLAMIVIGAGTGGTLTGISKKIKQVAPHIKMIAVDPVGSILAPSKNIATNEKGMRMTYKVEGIGYDFIPDCLDQCAADEWVKVDDRESFLMARRLIREEGLLCGGSSGSAVAAAIKIASTQLTKGQTCLVILPDSIRNYMSKFLSDDWMIANEFLEDPDIQRIHQLSYSLDNWRWIPISALSLGKPPVVDLKVSLQTALLQMRFHKLSFLPVVDLHQGSILVGIVAAEFFESGIIEHESFSEAKLNAPVSTIMSDIRKPVSGVTLLDELDCLETLHQALCKTSHVLVTTSISSCCKHLKASGCVSMIDLVWFLNYLSRTKGRLAR